MFVLKTSFYIFTSSSQKKSQDPDVIFYYLGDIQIFTPKNLLIFWLITKSFFSSARKVFFINNFCEIERKPYEKWCQVKLILKLINPSKPMKVEEQSEMCLSEI